MMRELLTDITHFNDLERGLPGVSRSLLAERLRRLVQAEVLDRINPPPRSPIPRPKQLAPTRRRQFIRKAWASNSSGRSDRAGVLSATSFW
jgi:hypothetical protein